MLKRKAYGRLVKWKNDPRHRSLVVKGARRVGKTSIIREFAKTEYPLFVELNFMTDPGCKAIFQGSLKIDDLLDKIMLFTGMRSIPPGSLLFFDEIQDCPEARRTLKSFTEDGRYDVIVSGRMLDVSEYRLGIYRDKPPLNIGVGYVDAYTMYPLDFEEFLWARSVPDDAISYVKGCIHDLREIEPMFYRMFSDNLKLFMVIGGMPEVVESLVNGDPGKAMTAMDLTVASIRTDINRYNDGSDVVKTVQCFNSIPSQLGDTNKKFTFSRITTENGERLDGPTKQKFFDNTLWLDAAGYGNFCYLTKQPVPSLKAQEIHDQYRIYLFDTGMLVHLYGILAKKAILADDYSYNQGALMENFVAECLMKSGIQPRCYRKTNGDNRMELDFVIEIGAELCVIEVKSGKHREFPAMSKAMGLYRIDRAVVFEKGNIYRDGKGVEHYPLFAAAFIGELVRPVEGLDEFGFPKE